MRTHRRLPVLPLCLAIASAIGISAAFADDSNIQSADTYQQGLSLLTSKWFSSKATTVDELNRIWTTWEPELRAKAEKASPEERRKMTFERYGFAPREFDKTGLPLGYTDDGTGSLAVNCFSCHGGKVAGHSYPGLPNTHQDLTAFATDLSKLKAMDRGTPEDQIKPQKFPIPLNFSKGVSNATMFSILLAQLRDKDLNLTLPRKHQEFVNNDMDAPPWWNYKKKEKIYCDAFAPTTHRTLMQFAMSPGVTGEQLQSWEPDFVKIQQFIKNLQPPKYPFAIDKEKAAKGKQVFEMSCSKCHGTYGEKVTFPNKVIPIDKIKTDPVRLGAIAPASKEAYNQMWFSDYGKHPVDIEVTGYLAQPLDGIWASAPYFHNGSVPTIEGVLNQSLRPKVWKRTEDGYDQKKVGLEVQAMDAVPAGLSERETRMFYNTTTISHSNGGHPFPDEELNPEEKLLVTEYLKTL